MVNILTATDVREGKKVAPGDLLEVDEVSDRTAEIRLPVSAGTVMRPSWPSFVIAVLTGRKQI